MGTLHLSSPRSFLFRLVSPTKTSVHIPFLTEAVIIMLLRYIRNYTKRSSATSHVAPSLASAKIRWTKDKIDFLNPYGSYW
uniref:Uncharacterized protein n=1 Tax=Picea glauca TaxID=3330 RepID=A0A101LVL1_PICGL|nr:hypothetical protein ABT39_MTgene1956 [Picea glauca]QHR92452.1 hypothetical protein Q903MT_gene6498 [Picea sitchensis]